MVIYMELNEIKREVLKYLKEKNVHDYDMLDIYKIMSHVLKLDINMLVLSDVSNDTIDKKSINLIFNIIDSVYIQNQPLQYVLNKAYFYNEEYVLDSKVLIPRQDSEILVQEAINIIEENKLKKMIDMCTGSGCIGISISKNSNISDVLMADISKEAIEVANKNINLNEAKKCRLINSDLFLNIKSNEKFDIIVSNPPYIKTSIIANLDENVKKEPIIALDGGKDGLDFYRKILDNARYYLKDCGYILFEIGYDQAKDVKEIINKYKFYDIIKIVKDYQNNDRVVICRFHQI